MECNEFLPKTREEARLKNSRVYFTGKPCKHGHIANRNTITSICYGCKKVYRQKDRRNNHEYYKKYDKAYYKKNQEKRSKQSMDWALTHKEKTQEMKRKNKDKYRKKYNEKEKLRCREKRKSDPFYRMSRNMSKAIWNFMKGLKGFRHWENIIGYTFEDLIKHLTPQLREGMTIENYGAVWHIDHKKPLSLFTSHEDVEDKVRKAFSLENLQPLFAFENLSKGNRYIE